MKYYIAIISFFLISFKLIGQGDKTLPTAEKNSLGITISPQDIGFNPVDKDVPTIRLDYRRIIKENLELRLSFGYQHDSNSLRNSGYSLALGLNRHLYQSKKLSIYTGAEIFFDKANIFNVSEREYFNSTNVGFTILGGLEIELTPKIDFLFESKIIDLSPIENSGSIRTAQFNSLKFLNGSQVGIKYRF